MTTITSHVSGALRYDPCAQDYAEKLGTLRGATREHLAHHRKSFAFNLWLTFRAPRSAATDVAAARATAQPAFIAQVFHKMNAALLTRPPIGAARPRSPLVRHT